MWIINHVSSRFHSTTAQQQRLARDVFLSLHLIADQVVANFCWSAAWGKRTPKKNQIDPNFHVTMPLRCHQGNGGRQFAKMETNAARCTGTENLGQSQLVWICSSVFDIFLWKVFLRHMTSPNTSISESIDWPINFSEIRERPIVHNNAHWHLRNYKLRNALPMKERMLAPVSFPMLYSCHSWEPMPCKQANSWSRSSLLQLGYGAIVAMKKIAEILGYLFWSWCQQTLWVSYIFWNT